MPLTYSSPPHSSTSKANGIRLIVAPAFAWERAISVRSLPVTSTWPFCILAKSRRASAQITKLIGSASSAGTQQIKDNAASHTANCAQRCSDSPRCGSESRRTAPGCSHGGISGSDKGPSPGDEVLAAIVTGRGSSRQQLPRRPALADQAKAGRGANLARRHFGSCHCITPAIAHTICPMTARTVDCPHCHRRQLPPDQPTASAVCPSCGKQFGVSKEVGAWGTHSLLAESNPENEIIRHGLPSPDEGLPELEYEEEEANPFQQHGRPVPPPTPPLPPPPVDPRRAWLVKGMFLLGFGAGSTGTYLCFLPDPNIGILLLVAPFFGVACGVLTCCLFVNTFFAESPSIQARTMQQWQEQDGRRPG